MFASIFIIVVSLILFVYWFRYTCLLILSAQNAKNYAPQVATANQLNFLEVRSELMQEAPNSPLEKLHRALDRDYRVLTYLLQHAATYSVSGRSIEERILMLDYQVMRVWYAVTRGMSSTLARRALLEQATVVNHLANAMGERVAVSARV
ncbi:MAG TPA: hypothetical protein VFL57_14140 [Bryobacteraceae bacterium]|nr:hypothetical protein [Bryobacteraceae bacterium]